jgi:hypothetical protein
VDAKRRAQIAPEQLVEVLTLGAQTVFGDRKVVDALRQAGVDVERFGTEDRLLRDVAGRDALRLFECPHRLPRRVDSRLAGHEVEVGGTDISGDLLPFCPDTLADDVSSQFGGADAETNLVLVQQREVDVAGHEHRELGRRIDLRLRGRNRTGIRVRTERARRKREVEGMQ